MAYAVRSSRVGTPEFRGELEHAVWAVNPNLPLAAVQTVAEIQARSMVQTSFALVMLSIAAIVSLLIGPLKSSLFAERLQRVGHARPVRRHECAGHADAEQCASRDRKRGGIQRTDVEQQR